MSWINNLQGDNFLAVIDVMEDIKNEIDIMADKIIIPILQTKVKFNQLLPIDSSNMKDKYCSLRWKATSFLEKNKIIKNFKILESSHRWESLIEINLDKEKFNGEYRKIIEEYRKNMESKMDIEERKKRRFLFIHKLYELSDTDINEICESYKIGEMLGFSNKLTAQILRYLEKEGLIKFRADDMSDISITHDGIKEVEYALSKPDEPTEYFPPARNIIIKIEKMTDSQIQIDSPQATQLKMSNKELFEKFQDLSDSVKRVINQLELNNEEKLELQAEIQTLDAQLSSSRPKINILKECVSSVRRILEGSTAQIIASQLLDKLPIIEGILQNI